uniref:MMS1_N domain-containing protein n=1 Tax=Macrostomum lignano TaxID=282301 RepID=A0A1I8FDW3_9PLAT
SLQVASAGGGSIDAQHAKKQRRRAGERLTFELLQGGLVDLPSRCGACSSVLDQFCDIDEVPQLHTTKVFWLYMSGRHVNKALPQAGKQQEVLLHRSAPERRNGASLWISTSRTLQSYESGRCTLAAAASGLDLHVLDFEGRLTDIVINRSGIELR